MLALRLAAGILGGAAALAAGLYAFALWKPAGAAAAGPFPNARLEAHCPKLSECDPDIVRRAGLHAPLGAPALSLKLQAAYSSGTAAERTELARLVLAQDPRSELARIVLAEEAYSSGDREGFLALYLPLFATDRSQARIYADVLAALSADSELYQMLEEKVRRERPYWGALYLSALSGTGSVPASGLIDLYAEFPAAQPSYLSGIAKTGNWAGAYILYSEFLSRGALAAEAGLPALAVPYNPGLRDVPAPAPFNWQVRGQGAEWLDGGGVYAFFQGRRGETFLTQTFPLPAGRWLLKSRMSGEVSETGGWYRWRLACAQGGRALADLDIHRLTSAPILYDFLYEHPHGACEFVTLSLIGVPGTFPQPARIEVDEVRLERAPAEVGAQ